MKKSLRYFLVTASFIGMGFTMPSCPGQKEMQTQIDTLQSTNLDLNRKIHVLSGQVSTLNNDMTQVKDLLSRMTNVIQAQKMAIEDMDKRILEIKAKSAHKAPAAKR